jgi:hypothetical protein
LAHLHKNTSPLFVSRGAMEYLPNANAAVSQTKKAATMPGFHWANASAEFQADGGITVLRKECSKFILYKIPERLKVCDELVAVFINTDRSSYIQPWGPLTTSWGTYCWDFGQ